MKLILSALLAAALLCLPAPAQTYRHQVPAILQAASGVTAPTPQDWYLRTDGGTRYSTNNPTGQCDGKGDAPAPAAGLINQHCAFGDLRYFAFDGTYNASGGKWVILGGDTVHIHKGQYRVGYSGPNPGDHNGLAIAGNPFAIGMPPIPSGTAAQHTKIVGDDVATTQIFGGYGAFGVLDLSGSAFVDITGVELTRHSQCTIYGSGTPAFCNKNYGTMDDYALNGIITSNSTHDVLMQNMNIHGFASRGIIGAIGGTETMVNVRISTNGGAGRDFDDGSATPSVNGLINWTGVTIEFSGCNQAYPSGLPASCYGQSNAGYGDGVGTPNSTCLAVNVMSSTFRYNVQEGLDTLHNNTTTCPLMVTNSVFYGNGGQAIKWGAGNTPAVFKNNTVIDSCHRMAAALDPAVALPTYNAGLGDYCRAGDGIAFNLFNGGTIDFENNTIVSYAPTIFDVSCADTTGHCAKASWTFAHNIVLAYNDPGAGDYGGNTGPGVFYLSGGAGTSPYDGGFTRTSNLYYQAGHSFAPLVTELFVSPQFVNQPAGNGATFVENELDAINTNLTANSPSAGMGAPGMIVGTAIAVIAPPPPAVVPPAPTYPLTFTTVVTVPAATIILPPITPPVVNLPKTTKTCTWTQASATTVPVLVAPCK